METKFRGLCAALSLVLAASACNDDPGTTPLPDFGNVNNVDQDAGNNTLPDVDVVDSDPDMPVDDRCVDVTCDPGLMCVRGDCVLETARLACDEITDLGTLSPGTTSTSGATTDFVDTLDTACVETFDGFSGAENAFQFQVDAPSLVQLSLTNKSTNLDWLMEIRTSTCASGTSVICASAEEQQFVAQPDTPYVLIVEPSRGADRGEFDVDLTVTAQTCAPPGSRSCENGEISVCGREETYGCAADCEGDAACQGDVCASAIVVTAAGSYTGDTQAYASTFDFGGTMSCSPTMDGGINTPGPDLVLSFPGITSGQTIVVDASMNDDNDNGIFVLAECDVAAECLAANDIGDQLSFTADADGDYFVVIDKLSASAKPFAYSVDIQ